MEALKYGVRTRSCRTGDPDAQVLQQLSDRQGSYCPPALAELLFLSLLSALQAEAYDKGLEQRVTRLEGIVSQLSSDKQ